MSERPVSQWPGESDKAYPEIFTTIPVQPHVLKSGQLNREQVNQFFNKGWVLVKDFFSTQELDPARESIKGLVDDLAKKLYNGGKITKLYEEYGLFQRLSMIEKEFPGANIILSKSGKLPQSFKNIWASDKLLNVAEQLLGTQDIVGHPVWNLRTKTPKNEATTVPWHQDSAYLDTDSYDVLQVTAWLPLLNTTEKNGCLQVVENGQKSGRVAQHQCCHGGTWYVMLEEEEMEKTLGVKMADDLKTLPVPYGGVLFFSNMLPHRSLNNLSDEIRWSLDLRWQRADHAVGFYGLADGVRMRSSSDPDYKVNWEELINRHEKAYDVVGQTPDPDREFDTTAPGPWMKQWEIVHTNRHTEEMEKQDREGKTGAKWHNYMFQMSG